MYEKKKIIAVACVIFATVALLVYLIFSGTSGNGNSGDAKNTCLLYTSPSPRDCS